MALKIVGRIENGKVSLRLIEREWKLNDILFDDVNSQYYRLIPNHNGQGLSQVLITDMVTDHVFNLFVRKNDYGLDFVPH